MYLENSVPPTDTDTSPPSDVRQGLHVLEEARLHLIDAMLQELSACAKTFFNPGHSVEDRDDAAWALAHAVDAVKQCDERLHALRGQASGGDRPSRAGTPGTEAVMINATG